MRRYRHDDNEQPPRLDLSALDSAFAAAPAPAARRIPDGRYHVVVEHVALATAAPSGCPLLKWQLRVVGPTHVGAQLWKHHVVAPQHLGWLKHDLELCGLQLDRLSDLPDHLERLLAVELEVTKRTRDHWDNVYFNCRLDPAPQPDDDDVPF
jgi:hypothetical protein